MPNIESVPEIYYEPLNPYHHEYDNLPLRNIIFRQEIINAALDANIQKTNAAAGDAGTLDNRLSQSLDANGELLDTAIDDAMHNIAYHNDGSIIISGDPVSFVRMLSSERDKLTLIADEATSLALRFETIGPSDTPITFDSGILPFEDSTTVSWRLESGKVQADLAFSTSAAHQHIYDIEPTHDVPSTPDYQNYKTTSISTAFIEGSLRVYINGTRLSQDQSVYAPGPTPADDMVLNSFTPDYLGGTFVLENAITSEDVIRIDFDIALV